MRRLLLSPALAPVVGACIAALLLLAAVPWLSPKTTRVWKGYYALLVREDAVGEETMRRALARASADALWEESAVVTFSDLESVAETTYGALSARLDSADPRMDPWLRGMDGYFRVRETGGAFPAGAGGAFPAGAGGAFPAGAGGAFRGQGTWRVAYLPAERTAAAAFRQLRRELGPMAPRRWRLAEYDPLEKALVLLAALACAVLMTLAGRNARATGVPVWLGVGFVICWFPFLASGGIPELCFVLALFPAWLRLAGGRRVRKEGDALAVYGLAAAAALAVLLVVAGFSWFRLLGGILAAACGLLLLALRRPLAGLRRALNRRRAFPSGSRRNRLRGPLPLGRAGVIALAVVPFVLLLAPQLRAPVLPVPTPLAGPRGFSWKAISALEARKEGGLQGLPDLADFVAHAAWQETLVFGRPYGLPSPGERVAVTEYVVDPATGTIVDRERTVKAFDSAWLAGLARRPAKPSVERLLLAQHGPARVGLGRGRPSLLADLIAAALCAGAMLAWFAGGIRLRTATTAARPRQPRRGHEGATSKHGHAPVSPHRSHQKRLVRHPSAHSSARAGRGIAIAERGRELLAQAGHAFRAARLWRASAPLIQERLWRFTTPARKKRSR